MGVGVVCVGREGGWGKKRRQEVWEGSLTLYLLRLAHSGEE